MKKHKAKHYSGWVNLVKSNIFAIWCVLAGILIGLIGIVMTQQGSGGNAGVGKKISTNSFDITVNNVTRLPYRDVFTRALIDGQTALIVRLTVVNTSANAQPFLPVNDMFIKDNYGSIRQMKPVYGIDSPIVAGQLEPGESVTGDISFVLENSNANINLFFDPRWDASPPAVIEVWQGN